MFGGFFGLPVLDFGREWNCAITWKFTSKNSQISTSNP
jgi:hypothetical protein